MQGYVSKSHQQAVAAPTKSDSRPPVSQSSKARDAPAQEMSWKSLVGFASSSGGVDNDLAAFYQIRDEMMNKKS
jgi:hypothetical protein